ncbi:MAG: hypothetical protein HS108_02660 [Planctomycetes bacterium]|jgi:hypothetical protein|nr:hypothetical protein [Planctomycetota bacterium]MCL4729068.1 hypothetical protein [Planctomycetota bacterium]
MSQADFKHARAAFAHMVSDLHRRNATGRAALAVELAQEMIASALESAAMQQQEAELSDVDVQLYDNAAVFAARVRVKGRAWPPRPPVDTRVSLAVRDITHSEAGDSGSVLFRVEKPLEFSSSFADILMGILGKLARGLPVSIDALRHKDALVTVDFAAFVRAFRPDLAAQARQVRLYGLKVGPGRVRAEVGFLR